jgi:tripartite-type tricarboxylate transporter receptor subunit TctC
MVSALIIAVFLVGSSHAQQFPSRPITILVGFGAGGATDTIARIYAQKMSEQLNTPVIVVNKPGASQLLAIHSLKSARPDGYTLYLATGSALAQGPAVRKDLDYDPLKDFSLIGLIGTSQGLITANSEFPVNSIGELISYANAHPGAVTYASAGFGGADHLETEYFMKITGTKMTHVPYKSDAEAMRAVTAGEVKIAVTTAQVAFPLVKADKVRALLITTSRQLPYLPNVPSLADLNVEGAKGLEPFTFFGLAGPADLPGPILNRLNEALNKISAMPDVAERMRSAIFTEPQTSSPAEFRAFANKEFEKWHELAKTVKVEE